MAFLPSNACLQIKLYDLTTFQQLPLCLLYNFNKIRVLEMNSFYVVELNVEKERFTVINF
jgi:hypothetical protein